MGTIRQLAPGISVATAQGRPSIALQMALVHKGFGSFGCSVVYSIVCWRWFRFVHASCDGVEWIELN